MATNLEKSLDDTKHLEDVLHEPQIKEAGSGELNMIDKTEKICQEGASQGFTIEEQKRIIRKVDWRVVPLLTFLYLVSFIDRSNSKFSLCFVKKSCVKLTTILQSEMRKLLA